MTRLAPRRPTWLVAVSSVVVLLLLAASGALLWRVGLFNPKTQASNAQLIAAALALVGALVTAALTFVGVVLKYSSDARAFRQTVVETSIRAVELLDEKATESQKAGAVFALANLDQLEFAFALLGQLWARGEVTPDAAVLIVDRILTDGDEQLQGQAAALLEHHAETLAVPAGFEFPASMYMRWRNDVYENARLLLVIALAKMALSKRRADWADGTLNAMVVQFDLVRRTDAARHIRNSACVILHALLAVRAGEMGPNDVLYAPGGNLRIADLRSEVASEVPDVGASMPRDASELASRLQTEWVEPPAGESD